MDMVELHSTRNRRASPPGEVGADIVAWHRGMERFAECCSDNGQQIGPQSLELGRPSTAAAPPLLRLERVLVPFDFSAASVRLLQQVASMELRPSTRVWILHVVSLPEPRSGEGAFGGTGPQRERLEAARLLLSRVVRDLRPRNNPFESHVVAGRPSDEIVGFARARRMDLTIMTAHGDRTRPHLRVSATTERVSRRAACPVLIVPDAVLLREERAERGWMANRSRILVLTDFSPNAAAALRCAAALAQEQNAALHVVNFAGGEDCVAGKFEARKRLSQWLDAHLHRAAMLKPIVRPGKPSVYMLLREAVLVQADLLVVGPRGYSWAERLRLNSRTDAILRQSPCPVLSVRPEALNLG